VQTFIIVAGVCILAIVAGVVLVLIYKPETPWWQILMTALLPPTAATYLIYRWLLRRRRR
jgi:hypothetical protein